MYGSVHGSIAEGKDDIKLTDFIFLPFNPVFKLVVLVVSITKATMGPIQSIYPIVICNLLGDEHFVLVYFKYFYMYFCDMIYLIDTVLHMAHRQVKDEAVKREYPPKSFSLLMLDIISMLPLFSIFYASENCPSVHFFPNILAFSEFIVIYRVMEYFSVATTHSLRDVYLGFCIMFALTLNFLSCFMVLMTYNGLCNKCSHGVYDWRVFVLDRIKESTDQKFETIFQATIYSFSLLINQMCDVQKPNSLLGLKLGLIALFFGYAISQVFVPKIFTEENLRLRRIFKFHRRATRIIEETKRRNPNPKAHKVVERFYSMSWLKREGVSAMPGIIFNYPRYFRTDVAMDLIWPVFYHSPTLRKTSEVYRRWLCLHVYQTFKLPNEILLSETQTKTHLYYLKSGTLQFVSSDDSALPLLSLRDGTLIGDINFYVPPYKRQCIVRCCTDCEIFLIPRKHIIQSLHLFPKDRENIMELVKDRLKHAKYLYTCKKKIQILDRSEEEGIAWIKRRWWEIFKSFQAWKKSPSKDEYAMPPEESTYHCSRFIGQLVLCTDVQLQKKSIFENLKFPWIIGSRSSVRKVWYNIMVVWVYAVLLFYPPLLTQSYNPVAFIYFEYSTDLMFLVDVLVNLITTPDTEGHMAQITFTDVLFQRFKSLRFLLDILCLCWVDQSMLLIGKPEWLQLSKFNRLLKLHIIFYSDYMYEWRRSSNPTFSALYKIAITQFCSVYVCSCFCFALFKLMPTITLGYFFGDFCTEDEVKFAKCSLPLGLTIPAGWTLTFFRQIYSPHTTADYRAGLILNFLIYLNFLFARGKYLATMYLKQSDAFNYRNLVSTLHYYYVKNDVHPLLLKRLHMYLTCNWKYNKGQNLMNPILLTQEPHDIIKKHQCEAAEKVIASCRAFIGANPMLISDLASKAKFMIMPKDSVLFLFGIKCPTVTWIINGRAKCEYHSNTGEMIKTIHPPGEILSINSVFFGEKGLKSFTAATDCEIIYINIDEFYTTIKRYPNEWAVLSSTIEEMRPLFKENYDLYFVTHKYYFKKQRGELSYIKGGIDYYKEGKDHYHNRFAKIALHIFVMLTEYRKLPESRLINNWLMIRALFIVYAISKRSIEKFTTGMEYKMSVHQFYNTIFIAPTIVVPFRMVWLSEVFFLINVLFIISLEAKWRWYYEIAEITCDAVTVMDIMVKLALPYYNERGVIVTNMRLCMWNYISRGFLADVIAVLPWSYIFSQLISNDQQTASFLESVAECSVLYLVTGIFNYHADMPYSNKTHLMVMKWHIVVFLMISLVSNIFTYRCMEIVRDPNTRIITSANLLPTCWIPDHFTIFPNVTDYQFQFIHAQSIVMAQSAISLTNFGLFRLEVFDCVFYILMGITYWLIKHYLQTLFVLNVRSSAGFRRAVNQLCDFLRSERVGRRTLRKAEDHYNYCWLRTKDLNIHSVLQDQVGVVFKEDICYFFYKSTFESLDTVLEGGVDMQRHLASTVKKLMNFLPREDIMREMDLTPWVYVIHRGSVVIYKDEKEIARLQKGAIFGQLDGVKPRPVRCTARADGHADILQMEASDFHAAITSEAFKNMRSAPTFEKDYVDSLRFGFVENPYSSIDYILRGRKSIKLPFMKEPISFENDWFARWQYVALLYGPVISATIVTYDATLPEPILALTVILLLMSFVHFLYFCSDFYALILKVSDDRCVQVYKGWNKLAEWELYVDFASLVIPMFAFITGNRQYHLGILLRLHMLNKFHNYYCKNYEATFRPMLLKLTIVLLLIHALTCGWILAACRPPKGAPFPIEHIGSFPDYLNKSLDFTEWAFPQQRQGGCSRITRRFPTTNNQTSVGFIVPRTFESDYLIALTFITIIFTRTNLDYVVPLTPVQAYYKVFVTAIVMFIELWVTSMILSAFLTKYFDLIMYDFQVAELIIFLRHSGLSKDLLTSISNYASWAWKSQRGCWLPEITKEAHICLQQDLMSTVYGHHLQAPPIFRENMPEYFLRQLAVKLERVVAFPGKEIVREGDIYPNMFFIHEGEVEKWRCDSRGDSRMCGLLTQKAYFGIIPALYPTAPHKYSYISRTVADLVTLRYELWNDLLSGYPEVKKNLYAAAEKLKETEK